MYLLLLSYNLWLHVRHIPYYRTWMNVLYAALNGWLAFGSLLVVLISYHPTAGTPSACTIAWYSCGTFVAIALMGVVVLR